MFFVERIRLYGAAPYTIAVLHGGPGAPGQMAPVARELSARYGVIEPLQYATSLEAQLHELRLKLQAHATLPVTLIGSSWGAMFGLIYAARFPEDVKRLIMVGSAVFDVAHGASIQFTRMARLDPAVRRDAATWAAHAANGDAAALGRLGAALTKAYAFDPLTLDTEIVEPLPEVQSAVWGEAQAMRRDGRLAALIAEVRCPVLALHGDYDPHPAEGVRGPLAAALPDFRFVLLEHCGHLPWIERQAKDQFYDILRSELR